MRSGARARAVLITLGLIVATVTAAASPARAAARAAGCAISGPAFAQNPAPGNGTPGVDRYVAFTYTRSNVWYGYAYNRSPLEYDAISWKVGDKAPTVIARYRGGVDLVARHALNVNVVGVTSAGGIIAAVARPTQKAFGPYYDGFAYFEGKAYKLQTGAHWENSQPVGVSDTLIAGLGAPDGGPTNAVTWASKRAPYVLRFQLFDDDGQAQLGVTDRGDLVYNIATDFAVQLAGGGPGRLLVDSNGLPVEARFVVKGLRVFSGDGVGVHVWDLSSPPASGDIRESSHPFPAGSYGVTSAGVRGDFVADVSGSSVHKFRTSTGITFTLPALSGPSGDAGEAIGSYGKLGVSLRSDGLPHFVTCS